MKLRFIEYQGELYLSLGITYDTRLDPPDCFVAVPINAIEPNIARSVLDANTTHIPIALSNEITNKSQLIALMVLYGW